MDLLEHIQEQLKPYIDEAIEKALSKHRDDRATEIEPSLSITDAANRLSLSKGMIYKLIREKKLTAFKAGASTRIEAKTIDKFIRENKK